MVFILSISNMDIFESPKYLDFSRAACLHLEPVIHLQVLWNEHPVSHLPVAVHLAL